MSLIRYYLYHLASQRQPSTPFFLQGHRPGIPTNKPSRRQRLPYRCWRTHEERWSAVADRATELSRAGRAILIGCPNISWAIVSAVAVLIVVHGYYALGHRRKTVPAHSGPTFDNAEKKTA